MCGEKFSLNCNGKTTYGSPPRVRGKDKPPPNFGSRPRITPACAGKSALAEKYGLSEKDHPRVCGEKHAALCGIWECKGSPPRVRGKGGEIGGDER